MKITFLGATEEVTGSKYLIEHENIKILVDCGMFQGPRELTRRNWQPLPIDPKSIDALVLTHAHIDHTGYIPVFVKNGFKGKIYCSKATYALCSLVLIDSGHLQEEEAKRINASADPNHPKVEPLYTEDDAKNSLHFFHTVDYDTTIDLGDSLQATLIYSGHILGSSFVVISDGKQKLTFSGDLGRPHQLIMRPPTYLKQTDFLVIESTYGNRIHKEEDPIKALSTVINETVKRGGVVVIPSFAVGRTQEVLYCLYQLKQANALPQVPIYLDSPLAIGVTNFFCQFKDELELSESVCEDIFKVATFTPTADESKTIDRSKKPAIIVAGSGMADGGRVVHHLEHFISDQKNTIVFMGFQAPGTLGYMLIDGAKKIKIHGQSYDVHAKIKIISTLSAHADYPEILQWLGHFETPPKKVFVTHGEPEGIQSLQQKIVERFGWSVVIPKYLESFELD